MANTTGKKFGGRQKGTPNKDTKQLREKIDDLLDNQWEQIQNDFGGLSPKERIDVYAKLLEYALPKLNRASIDIIETQRERPDLSKLTYDELLTLKELHKKIEQANEN